MDNEQMTILAKLLRTPALVLFAAIAGALGYLMRTLDKKEPLSKARLCLEAAASGFVGLITIWLCHAMNLSYEWTGVVVGVCGWLGAHASIQLLQKVVWAKLRIK